MWIASVLRTINYHIKRVFNDYELEPDSVIRNFQVTAADDKTYTTKHNTLRFLKQYAEINKIG